MVTIIQYEDIKQLTAIQAVEQIIKTPKFTFEELTILDVLNKDWLGKSITDSWYNDMFKKGIYLLYNDAENCVYVGQTKDSFYGRFMAQLDTRVKNYWGWNVILKKMGMKRLGVAHDALKDVDHEFDYNELIKYKLLLVEVPYLVEMEEPKFSTNDFKYLERLLIKAHKQSDCPDILNTRTGWLWGDEHTKTLTQLIGK